MDKEKYIIKLTNDYYELISADHHKDRDCHWYVNKVWSYGDKPMYRVEHYGYCYEEFYEDFVTYEKARDYLISKLEDAIKGEKE